MKTNVVQTVEKLKLTQFYLFKCIINTFFKKKNDNMSYSSINTLYEGLPIFMFITV